MAILENSLEVRRYGGEAAEHSHPHHQVVLPLQGVLEMEVGGRGGQVSAVAAAAITAGQTHSFAGSDGNAFLILDTAANGPLAGLRSRLWDVADSDPFLPIDPSLTAYCAFLAGEMNRFELSPAQLSVAGDLLLGALSRRLDIAQEPLTDPLARAVAEIKAHYAEPLSIADICRKAGLGISRFHELFRRRFGATPAQYIAELRLSHAARLLAESTMPLCEIALASGYGDQSAFTRAFRRHFGMPPARYRRENRHNIP